MPVWHRFTAPPDGSVPRRGLPQEVTISGSGHPSRSRQMAVMDAARASRLESRVNPEQDFHRFGPLGAVGGGVVPGDRGPERDRDRAVLDPKPGLDLVGKL